MSTSVSALAYSLNQTFSGPTFFDNFNFYTGDDPTHGYVDFVGRTEAENLSIIGFDDVTGLIYMGADFNNVVPSDGRGRKAVRLESNFQTSGDVLIVIDLVHMPSSDGHLSNGCGVWPAFWSFGPDWPHNGEIDIIEYANSQITDLTTLHTDENCNQWEEDTSTFTGAWGLNFYGQPGTNCDVNAPDQYANAGCGISSDRAAVGSSFNARNGGIYALEWISSTEIKAFYFDRDSIPGDLMNKTPNPSAWGLPYARFEVGSGSNCSSGHFGEHSIIFDLTFCGRFQLISTYFIMIIGIFDYQATGLGTHLQISVRPPNHVWIMCNTTLPTSKKHTG